MLRVVPREGIQGDQRHNHDASLSQWRLEVERTRYEAERVERRYRAVEPENRLVARGLPRQYLLSVSLWLTLLRDTAGRRCYLIFAMR